MCFNVYYCSMKTTQLILFTCLIWVALLPLEVNARNTGAVCYTVSMPGPETQRFMVELILRQEAICAGVDPGVSPVAGTLHSLVLRMPGWMPGYYQMMHYGDDVEDISAFDCEGRELTIKKAGSAAWRITCPEAAPLKAPVKVIYYVKAMQRFVARSFLDATHAYIVPCNTFLYVDQRIHLPVTVAVKKDNLPDWTHIATGLEPVAGQEDVFYASDFDILYDSPILAGNLKELPGFEVEGVPHRFLGFGMEPFDGERFMASLQKVVKTAVSLMGDIPYTQYTFIGIGPGMGGIEHLNSTTVSFDGKGLDAPESFLRTMDFLCHEYFHHFNVKRIRPFELGPFDYENGSRTNQLWISEGLTEYYTWAIMKASGLTDTRQFLAHFESNIKSLENNPGRFHQSLAQSSYNTWSDGPFGGNEGKTVSYYIKGPLAGLLLDLEIRHVTGNSKSLDDVMRTLYNVYYKEKGRGFTDAEFQFVCETVAGKSLAEVFEYIYTTKTLDYNKYLSYAGLILIGPDASGNYSLKMTDDANPSQTALLKSWLRE